MAGIRAPVSSAPWSARWWCCSSGTGWCRPTRFPTPARDAIFSRRRLAHQRRAQFSAPDRSGAQRAPRDALDNDGARRAGAAGDGETVDVLALAQAQHGAAGLVAGDIHQRRHDLDLLVELIGQALGGLHRFFDSRRVAPHTAPAILRVPYVAHVPPFVIGLAYDPGIQDVLSAICRIATRKLCSALTRISTAVTMHKNGYGRCAKRHTGHQRR